MDKDILNIQECAKFLHISTSMLRKLIYSNQIENFKIGNRYYFKKQNIQNWIDNKIRRYYNDY